ncbi:hypothetical protein D3C76_294640 [compost metagenome]
MRKMYNDVGLCTHQDTKGLYPCYGTDRYTDKPLILTFASAGTKDSYSVSVPNKLYTMKQT